MFSSFTTTYRYHTHYISRGLTLLVLFSVQVYCISTSSMVKQDHMKDLCGSIRARELAKRVSFEFSSQLTENKAVAGH